MEKSFADRVAGAVIAPGDVLYDEARRAWNLAFTHSPALIVQPATVEDVVETVRYARERNLKVAVQATGHGVTVPADSGALLLQLAKLDHVRIDGNTAIVGGGATWASVLAAAQQEGLSPLVGSSPGVGVVGYTLGGGLGWLGRRYGLAADHLRAATVVLANGSVVRATERDHADLFWALRGGGAGNLGVVVGIEVGLVPVESVYAGNLLYPIEAADAVFERFVTWSESLPPEMTSSITLMNYPPLEMVPEPLRGRSFAIVRGCHCGDVAEATALVDQWRSWSTPEFDMFRRMPFAEMAEISQDPLDPLPALSSGRWLTGLDGEVLDAMTEALAPAGGPSPVLFVESRHGGGAISRSNEGASFAARTADRLIQLTALTPSPDAEAEARARVARLWERLDGKIATPGVYTNFVEGAERAQQAAAAFDARTWNRLASVKRAVDPEGVFAYGLPLAT